MPRTRNRSRGELVAVSSLAVATVLATGGIVAHAQSFQGNGEVVAGSASIFATGSTTSITVNSANAVIDWTPFDDASGPGPISFQPNGTTATFRNNFDTTSDFAVLNRILPADPTRAVQFDGNVVSQLQTVSGTTRGGTVFFYSPGGILVGSNAVFDVGNLGLTTSDLPYDAQTGAFSTNGVFTFQQSQAGSAIDIAPGAQINVGAPGPDNNSYLVMVAPQISQGGAIDVNGSAALVAADAATIEFSPSNLFSIRVDQGTSASGAVLANSGTIGGAAGSSSAFIHRIYMVAVPRNTAITMAIAGGSALGFDVAGAADVVGNAVILSAGHDITGGVVDSARSAGGGTGRAEIALSAFDATSAVEATATGRASLSIGTGETANFASNLVLRGVAESSVSASVAAQVQVTGADANLNVAGGLSVIARDAAEVGFGTVNDTSTAAVTVDGGSLTVGRGLSITASRFGLLDTATTTGGSAILTARNAAQITVGDAIDLDANGYGSSASSAVRAGTGRGGTAQLNYGTGATITAGAVNAFAEGTGGEVSSGYGGGTGQGGIAEIRGGAGGGSLTVLDRVAIGASGTGTFGEDCATCVIEGGTGLGGTAAFSLTGATQHSVSIGSGGLSIVADAAGGDSYLAVAGDATGGTAGLSASGNHSFEVSGSTEISANARGGDQSGTSQSGAAFGGTAQVVANGAAMRFASLDVNANARGGADFYGGLGGQATGGIARVRIGTGGGTLQADDVGVTANARGGGSGEGLSGTGADAIGGSASVDAVAGLLTLSSLQVSANGDGGNGQVAAGNGTGGLAALRSTGGAIDIGGTVEILANGASSIGGVGGAGLGGHALISTSGGTLTFGGGDGLVSVQANGGGGVGFVTAGDGTGGLAEVISSNGSIAFNAGLTMEAEGAGGRGNGPRSGDGGAAGAGLGGQIRLDAQSSAAGASAITGSLFTLSVAGTGGDGGTGASTSSAEGVLTTGNGGAGGSGTGGSVLVNAGAGNGNLTPTSLVVYAAGVGGVGGSGGSDFSGLGAAGGSGGRGGQGLGGSVLFDTDGALSGVSSSGKLQAGALVVTATGEGGQAGYGGAGISVGDTGAGGNGTGGSVTLRADRGGSLLQVDGNTSLLVTGIGAQGLGCNTCALDAGKGSGGSITFTADGTTTGNQIKLATVFTDAGGIGGGSVTTNGAQGLGGSVRIIANSGLAITTGDLALRASGFGGDAQFGFAGGNATGGVVDVEIHAGSSLAVIGDVTLDTGTVGGNNTALTGRGGDAQGGTARLRSVGGDIVLSGDASVNASAFGGTGDQYGGAGTGGNAVAGSAAISAGNIDELGNGGAISLAGATNVAAYARGGSGGTGGNATAGDAGVYARHGSVTLGSLTVDGRAIGGDGQNGGAGGAATGGVSIISTENAVEGEARITVTSATVLAQGFGGTGGTARNGTGLLGVGGAGGSGTGGAVQVLGSAGNGKVTIDTVIASAEGLGGAGGGGGDNDSPGGGSGGFGGTGKGGTIQVGTRSGADTGSLNEGFAHFGTVSASASGIGGNGGNGGLGGTELGLGGNGGDGIGGGATLLVRGSEVTLSGDGFFDANGIGGNGGTGSVQGNGGNGAVGVPSDAPGGIDSVFGAHMLVTSRYFGAAQRGSVIARNLSFNANASGGLGATNGVAAALGEPIELTVRNSDVTAQSLGFSASGTAQPDSFAAPIDLRNGNVTLTGGFAFSTPGELFVVFDKAKLAADHASIDAGNWVNSGIAVATPGTIEVANALTVASLADIVGDVSLKAGTGISVAAPGEVRLADVSAGGGVAITAGETVSVGDLAATGLVIVSGGGDVSLGSVDATSVVSLSSGGALDIAGAVNGVNRVSLSATGPVTSRAISVTASSDPASIRELSVRSDASVALGNIDAGQARLFAAGSISIDNANTNDFAALGGGDIALGGIDATGRVLIADYSMADAGGSPLGSAYNYDALFAAETVATAGSIASGGRISAASLTAATTRTLSLQAIDVTGGLSLTSSQTMRIDGTVTAGAITISGGANVVAGTITARSLALTSGDAISLGSVRMDGPVSLTSSGGAIRVVDIVSGGDIALSAAGDISTTGGTVTTPAIVAQGGFTADTSSGAISLGNVSAQGAIDLGAQGAIATGTIATSGNVALLSRAGGLSTQDIEGAAVTLSAAGPVAIGAATSAGALSIDTGGSVLTGTLDAGGDLLVAAGGDVGTAGNALRAGGALSVGTSSGAISLGDVSAQGAIDLGAQGTIATGTIATSGNVALLSRAGGLSTQDIEGAAVTLSAAGPVAIGAATSAGALSIDTGGSVLTGALDAGGDLLVAAGGDVGTAGNALRAGGALSVGTSSGAISLGDLAAQGAIDLGAPGAITAGAVSAQGAILVRSQDAGLTLGEVTAATGSLGLSGAGEIRAGNVASGLDLRVESIGGAVRLGSVMAGGSADLLAGNALATGDIVAGGRVDANAGASATIGAIAAASMDLSSGGAIGLGALRTEGSASLTSSGGSIRLVDIVAGGDIALSAAGDISTTGGSATTPAVSTQGGFTADSAAGSILLGNVTASGGVIALSAGSAVTTGALSAAASITVRARGGNLSAGVIAGGPVSLLAAGAMSFGSLSSSNVTSVALESGVPTTIVTPGDVSLIAGNDINGTSVAASGGVSIQSQNGRLTLGNVAATQGPVDLFAAGMVATGTIQSGSDLRVRGASGSVELGALNVAGSVELLAGTGLTTTSIVAGSAVSANAGTSADLGAITARSLALTSGDAISLGSVRMDGPVSLTSSGGAIRVVDIVSGGDIALSAAGDISTTGGTVTTPAIVAQGGFTADTGSGAISLGNVSAQGAIDLGAQGAIATGTIATSGNVALLSRAGGLSTQDIEGAAVTLSAAGPVAIGAATSAGALSIDTGGSVLTGTLDAGGDLLVAAGGDVGTAGNALRAGGALSVGTSSGAISLGDVSVQGAIDLGAPGAITAGAVSAQGAILVRSQDAGLTLGEVTAATGSLGLSGAGEIRAGNVASGLDLRVESIGGAVRLGSVTAGGSADLLAGNALATGDIVAGGRVDANAGASATIGAIAAASGDISLGAGGALKGLGLFAGQGAITLRSGEDAELQTVSARDAITANIGGNAAIASISSRAGGIQVRSGGNLSSGLVSAATDIALVAAQGLSLGNVIGRDMALLAAGSVVAGQILSGRIDPETGALVKGQGKIVIGNASMGGSLQAGAFDIAALASGPAVRIGGSLRLRQASGGSFASASNGRAELGQIDATRSISVESGSTAVIKARWAAPSITVSSSSIAINSESVEGQPLGLDAGVSGSILLRSLSQDGITLGDGFGVTEWSLTSSEWALIRSGSLTIRALDGVGGVDFRIGNLDITGPEAGSTIDDPTGTVRFETVNDAGQVSGGIRILGNVAARGFLSSNALEFATGRFEIDAATGSLGVYGSSSAVSGIIRIAADGIHVAEGTILDKLAQDIAYAGLADDLARPTAIQRPGGILSAGAFDLAVGRSFYVQNTGTADVPAGFLTAAESFRIAPRGSFPIRMIVNGQFLDNDNVLSGKQAFAAFIRTHSQLQLFEAGSSVDGCLISVTACGETTPVSEPEIPIEVAGPTIWTQIDVLEQNDLGETPGFTAEPDDPDALSDEQREAVNDAAGPPIVPPTPLIDMRPLNPPGRIEEPVAGSGNPALVGSPVDESAMEGGQ